MPEYARDGIDLKVFASDEIRCRGAARGEAHSGTFFAGPFVAQAVDAIAVRMEAVKTPFEGDIMQDEQAGRQTDRQSQDVDQLEQTCPVEIPEAGFQVV